MRRGVCCCKADTPILAVEHSWISEMHCATEHEVNAFEGDLFRNVEYNTPIHLSFHLVIVR